MPMYYFYLLDSEEVVDSDGTELPDLDAAREHAKQVARELTFKRDGMLQRGWSEWTMCVRDMDGQVLLSFPLDGSATNSRPTDGRDGASDIKKSS
jgi:hypothetical protein